MSELLWFLEGSTDERRLAEIHFGKKEKRLLIKKPYGQQTQTSRALSLVMLTTKHKKSWALFMENSGGLGVKTLEGRPNKKIIEDLKNNPNSRRHIVSAWNVDKVEEMALPPCHTMFQFHIQDKELNCQLYQRSADMFWEFLLMLHHTVFWCAFFLKS